MTNHWIDLRNSDVILIMGANPAENHPISFRWVMEGKKRGAKVIHVDPRFTRTSTRADIYAPLRSGTDIAFLGGMLNYILQNDLVQLDYVVSYTDAGYIIKDGFGFNPSTGVFSGFDPGTGKYTDKSLWAFEKDGDGVIVKDRTLQHPRCVYQFLKQHYARYDLATVSGVTGTPQAKLQAVYETFVNGSRAPDKAGTIMYAMGYTQHTVGVQNIRAMSMIQMLLGNVGVAGGGVNAMRGESNVQGSTDQALLYHYLPGYLASPTAAMATLQDYKTACTPTSTEPCSANWWGNYPKYITSFLKSMYGAAATPGNDYGYGWLPKREAAGNYAWSVIFDAMYQGSIKGFLAWGQNPASSSANVNKVRAAMGKLDWMITVNLFPNETAEFWRGPGMDPAAIGTEVFLLPAAAFVEKEGSISNSGRWAQWRYKAVEPLGDSRPDAEMMDDLFVAIRDLYRADGGSFPDPILNLKWDYFGGAESAPRLIAKEMNGYFHADVTIGATTYHAGDLVPGFPNLLDDGRTSAGNWLHCNSYTSADFATGNKMARRTREATGIGLNSLWAWSWPMNRRIIYNRASVDLTGAPHNPARPVISWNGTAWVGDVADGGYPPMKNPDLTDNPASKLPFIMQCDGVASLFSLAKLQEGPVPEHYEPLESPLAQNPMGHSQRLNPAVYVPPAGEMNAVAQPGGTAYPIVCTTYRVIEHWQTGVMTRSTPWLNELQPDLFVELSEQLAAHKSIANGERVKVRSARGEVSAVAIVTKRFQPFLVNGQTVHQVGLPWCFDWVAPIRDKTRSTCANLLTPNVGDPNTRIPESKAFMVDVVKEV